MSESRAYLTPLPGWFAASLESALNRLLAADSGARRQLRSLAGKTLGLQLEGTGLQLYFTASDEQMRVQAEAAGEVATWIRGTPLALFGMTRPERAGGGKGVTIEGDAALARDFEQLLASLDFDWEEKLGTVVGDVAAHQLGLLARGAGDFARRVLDTGRKGALTGLREMARTQANEFTRRAEFDSFRQEVDELRSRTDKLIAGYGTAAED